MRMKMTFVVLSKSAKNGNKCVAGMQRNGKLVRIVTSDMVTDGAIPNWYMKNSRYGLDVQILDEIEVEVLKNMPNEIQPENYLIDTNKLPRVLGHESLQEVIMKVDNDEDPYVFMNNARFLKEEEATSIDYSLKIIIADSVQISVNSYGKTKADFTYNDVCYVDISVTDHDYFDTNGCILTKACLFLSLAHQPYTTDEGENRYYKFIAKIFDVSPM